jgi:meiotic recombination protein SPO11
LRAVYFRCLLTLPLFFCIRICAGGAAAPPSHPCLPLAPTHPHIQILVVEKDAVFQRLAEDALHLRLPTILVTARGMPDLATRVALARLHAALPALPVFGLVDWNPSGALILRQYRYGSRRLALEAARYTIPSLRWLGARWPQLEPARAAATLPPGALQPLTTRDRALIRSLQREPLIAAHCPGWGAELEAMEREGVKAEIEAMYAACGGVGKFADALVRLMLRHDAV